VDDRLVLHRYYTSVDRAGLAIATGGVIGGVLAVLLFANGGQASLFGLVAALVLGTLFSALGITAVGVPVWAVLHVSGRRGPVYAALVGAALGFLLFLAAQTGGFGLGTAVPSDAATRMVRWLSAGAISLGMAAIAALTGLAMWRVAYRRVR
jgi:hypothetical protein